MWRGHSCPQCSVSEAGLLHYERLDHHKLSHAALIEKLDAAGDLGKQGVVLAATDVKPRLNSRAPLPHNDRAAGDNLSAERLKPQPLRVRITPFREVP